ncbi:hypothetical protein [Methylocystis rosea]|uniref:hypothetical protein n=1 Tax=Methylocystis rosea TaxID=173366 RepID=UPI00037B5853|nr:hypothetical protein [Methylocystis rosea]
MSETEKLVNKKQFGALIKAADQAKTKVASVNGEIGERIKHAVENGNLHAGAFKAILKLYRMDSEKRDAWLRSFDAYRDMAGELNLFEEHVGDLDDMARRDTQKEAEEAEAAQVAENVERLENGISQLSDEEREFDDATSSKPSRRRAKKSEDDGADEKAGTYSYQ